MNIGNIMTRNASQYESKPALIFEGNRWSWRELDGRVNQLAQALIGLGLQKGDKVAVLSENEPGVVETSFACAKAGAVYFPLMARMAPDDICHLIDLSDAKVLVFQTAFLPMVEDMRAQLPKVETFVQLGDSVASWATGYEQFLASGENKVPDVEVLPDDDYCFICTGGTTGVSKLGVLTHANALAAIHTAMGQFEITEDDIGLQVMPLFHVIVNGCINPCLAAGATVVLMRRFEEISFMKTISEEKVTFIAVVPPFLFAWVMKVPEAIAYDVTHVRLFVTAATTFPDDLKRSVLEYMPKAKLLYVYGLTESSGGNATALLHNDTFRKTGAIGMLNPLLGHRVVDDAGKDVPVGEPGELLLKGPQIIRGYYKRDDETKATFIDGWLHTGDIVKEDADGFLYFVDRLKDMIKTGGENVFAKEVEDVLLGNPKVAEVGVFGLPDAQWGEKVHAAIVLKNGEKASVDEIGAFVKEKLVGYKRPKAIHFVPMLPRNPSGKILKHMLKKDFVES